MLKSLQAVTGLAFALFVLAHLLNIWLAALGPGLFDDTQSMLRGVYQFPPLEVLLLASGAVHAVIGIMRWVGEPKRQLNSRARWRRYSAVFLLLFIVGHVAAVRGPSFFYGVYPRFEGLAFSIDYVPYYFYPYYFLLAMAGLYHGLNGSALSLRRIGLSVTLSTPALRAVTGVAGILTVLALAGLGGAFFDVGPVRESDFARLGAELFGLEL